MKTSTFFILFLVTILCVGCLNRKKTSTSQQRIIEYIDMRENRTDSLKIMYDAVQESTRKINVYIDEIDTIKIVKEVFDTLVKSKLFNLQPIDTVFGCLKNSIQNLNVQIDHLNKLSDSINAAAFKRSELLRHLPTLDSIPLNIKLASAQAKISKKEMKILRNLIQSDKDAIKKTLSDINKFYSEILHQENEIQLLCREFQQKKDQTLFSWQVFNLNYSTDILKVFDSRFYFESGQHSILTELVDFASLKKAANEIYNIYADFQNKGIPIGYELHLHIGIYGYADSEVINNIRTYNLLRSEYISRNGHEPTNDEDLQKILSVLRCEAVLTFLQERFEFTFNGVVTDFCDTKGFGTIQPNQIITIDEGQPDHSRRMARIVCAIFAEKKETTE